MENIGFTNYRKGTKDPKVFDVPPECNKATPREQVQLLASCYVTIVLIVIIQPT